MSNSVTISRDEWERFLAAFQRFVAAGKVAPAVAPPAPAPAPAPRPPEVSSAIPPTPKMAWGQKVSADFRDKVWWIACTLKIDVNWIMACIAWESGESFSPSKKNLAGSGATGLIQFMPDTARALGTTTDQLARMTAETQLNYVYKYLRAMIKVRGQINSIEDCYMSILWPAGVGQPLTYTLFRSAIQYRQNAGLDVDKDGKITKFEAASHVRAKLAKGLKLAA